MFHTKPKKTTFIYCDNLIIFDKIICNNNLEYPSKILTQAIEEISQLPGIGKRTALRLALHMLNRPQSQTKRLANALNNLVENLKQCQQCHNICDEPVCDICKNPHRNQQIICVVEDVRDVMAIESTGMYKGVYHILGGKISPIDGIGPDQLNIESLTERTKNNNINEIIFAMSSTVEGDTTIFYLYKLLNHTSHIKFTAIARGIGIGEELEYTDELTLAQSLENRTPYTEASIGL